MTYLQRPTTVFIIFLLVSILGAGFILQPNRVPFSGTFPVNAKLEANYNLDKKSVEIAVTEGHLPAYTDDSGGDLILTGKNFSKETENISSNLTIKGYGKKNKNGYWAEYQQKFFQISFPGSALTGLPVEENETVKIIGDGDGNITNGDKIFLYRKEENYELVVEFKITENSVKRGYWGMNYNRQSVGINESAKTSASK